MEHDSMLQVKNSRRLRFDKCINPEIDENKSIINFTYDFKSRSITGQLNQLKIIFKLMKNEISFEEFEKKIKSNNIQSLPNKTQISNPQPKLKESDRGYNNMQSNTTESNPLLAQNLQRIYDQAKE